MKLRHNHRVHGDYGDQYFIKNFRFASTAGSGGSLRVILPEKNPHITAMEPEDGMVTCLNVYLADVKCHLCLEARVQRQCVKELRGVMDLFTDIYRGECIFMIRSTQINPRSSMCMVYRVVGNFHGRKLSQVFPQSLSMPHPPIRLI